MRVSVTILGLDLLTLEVTTTTTTDPDEWHGDVKTELVGFTAVEQGE